jgi:hypothetical protein
MCQKTQIMQKKIVIFFQHVRVIYSIYNSLWFCLLQTIIHVFSIFVSIGAYFAFSLVYNSLCVQCFNLPSNYWVVQHASSSATYWLVVFLSVVMALIPRFVYHAHSEHISHYIITIRHRNPVQCECTRLHPQ